MLANDVPMAIPVGLNLPSEIHALACQAATICSPGDKIYNIYSFVFLASFPTGLPHAVSIQLDVVVRTKDPLHFTKSHL